MKKAITILMTLVLILLSCVSVPAMAASTPTFVWEDCAVQILSYNITQYNEEHSATMRLFARVLNNKDYKISVWLQDATVDGVAVRAAPIVLIDPHSDTGVEDPKNFYFYSVKEDDQARISKALISARKVQGTLEFQNSDTKEVLFRSETITIDLDTMEGTRKTPRPKETATPKPTSTPAPKKEQSEENSPPYYPASTDYFGLKEGSTGQAVKDVQQRLWDLGYYRGNVDGNYGLSTTIAVRSFCNQNGLPVGTDVTPEMQRLLYSTKAKHYKEPYLPLVMGPQYKWDNPDLNDNIGWFYPQVVNRCSREIRGYELYYYFENVWGEKMTGEKGAYLYPCAYVDVVESGEIKFTQGFPVHPFASVCVVYVGVKKIAFSDGEVREISNDEIQFFRCPIKGS